MFLQVLFVCNLDTYSNTTLVKVKFYDKLKEKSLNANSNTTLVKVKLGKIQHLLKLNNYSNTTLVKVKYNSQMFNLIVAHQFKYNSC